MNLVLRGISLNDNALSQPLVGRFDERGGSIGRSDNATMTLPDPERLISRVQANVSFGAATYWLEDVGSANPVLHNGLPLGPGVKVPLKPNDDLRIGGYRLSVEYEETDSSATILRGRVQGAPARAGGAAARPPAVPPPAAPPPAAPRAAAQSVPEQFGANPFSDLIGPGAAAASAKSSPSDPFADLLTPSAAPEPQAPPPRTPPPAPGAAAPARLPDDFDPFSEFAPKPPPPVAPTPAADPLGLVGASPGGGRSIDDMFGLGGAPERDPMADFLAPPPAAGRKAKAEGPSLDPLAMFEKPAPPPPTVMPAASDHVPELSGAFKPPGVATPKAKAPAAREKRTPATALASSARRAAPPPPAAPAAGPSSYTADDIWQGFLDGAGVDIHLPRGVTPEMMRTIGVMLRNAIEGMLQLIAVRAAAKNELRAPVTVIQVRENNPLKFSPDASVALLQLLQPPGRGFLPGPEAVRDAMVDLQSHQIGTMAGMRAALAGVLERFQPELLEGRLTGQSMLDALLPMNRKAKLWELFLQHYRAIRNDAEDDFHELFGKAFVEAYAAQVERLTQAQDNNPTR